MNRTDGTGTSDARCVLAHTGTRALTFGRMRAHSGTPADSPAGVPRGIGTNHIAIGRPRGARFRHHRPLPQRSQISSPKTIFANPRSTARNGGKDGVGGLTGAATVWVTSWPA